MWIVKYKVDSQGCWFKHRFQTLDACYGLICDKVNKYGSYHVKFKVKYVPS